MNATIITGGLCAACWGLFLYMFRKDRSRYRNCYFLFFALVSVFPFVISLFPDHSWVVLMVTADTALLSILIVPFFLIINGIVMIRREGRRLSQLLSLLLGVVILLGEAVFIAGVARAAFSPELKPALIPRTVPAVAAAIFCLSVIYGSMSFLIFMVYTLFLQMLPPKKDFDYVIIHGAGLLNGDRVSKLLQDRLDKAIHVYRSDPSPTKLIPSGGQGADETVPEAEAMKRYLLAQGVPEEDILTEDRSTTTMENLQFSKRIIDAREGRKYTALVTSNYHVYRALRYCRAIGLNCTGIGSHVAFYYWPTALIREYIAIHMEKKRLFWFLLGWALSVALLMILIFR